MGHHPTPNFKKALSIPECQVSVPSQGGQRRVEDRVVQHVEHYWGLFKKFGVGVHKGGAYI